MARVTENRNDGWTNLFTLLGTKNDAAKQTTFRADIGLTEQQLDALYTENGLCRRIVELLPKHAVRRWCEIENDDDSRYTDELNRLKVRSLFREASIAARLNGGSVIVIYTDDSAEMDQPFNLEGAGSTVITGLEVFDRWHARPVERYDEGIKTGRAEIYACSRWDGSTKNVHESRTLYFDGARCTANRRKVLEGFGDSVLVATYEQARSFGSSLSYVESLLSFYDTGVMTLKGLAAKLAGGQEKDVKKRIEYMSRGKSLLNTIILDEGESYDRRSSSLTGIPDVLDRLGNALSAASGYPVKILLGTSPAGLQATGDADIRVFYDDVNTFQVDELEPNLNRILEIIETYIPGLGTGKPKPKWLALWEPTDKESAEVRKSQAETDGIYIDKGVLDPMEVRKARFVGGGVMTTSVYDIDDIAENEPDANDTKESGAGSAGGGLSGEAGAGD